MRNLLFELAQVVEIDESKETGTVIARSESTVAEPQYLVRYKNGHGVAVEAWWSQSALSAV